VTTLIFPAVAPAGTIAPIRVDDLTVKLALTPLNLTEVAPVKFVPLIFTVLPTEPLVGAKLVIVGGPTTVKLVALVAVPPGAVTAIGPVVAPTGTVAVI
jgi:hypothetical protein